jgi:hypothetical protein
MREIALTEREARHLAAIVRAAIEGAFQLSVSARGVMPTGYAASALMELVEARLERAPRWTSVPEHPTVNAAVPGWSGACGMVARPHGRHSSGPGSAYDLEKGAVCASAT